MDDLYEYRFQIDPSSIPDEDSLVAAIIPIRR